MSYNACENGTTLDEQFAIFLNPIRDLAQNWEINISQILEEYLEKIDGIQKNFQNRSSVLNFAEAAMVVQGSVNIYSKKVDFFEKVILQVLSDLASSHSNYSVTEESTNNKKGRAKKMNSISLNDLEFKNLDDIEIGKNIDLVENDDIYLKKRNFKFIPVFPIQLDKSENDGSHETELYEKDEFISYKSDYYLNRCFLRPGGSLSMDQMTHSSQDTQPQVSETNCSVLPDQPTLEFQDCNESFNDPVRESEPHDLEICNEEKQAATNDQNTQVQIAQLNVNIGECELQPGTSKDVNNNISQEKDITVANISQEKDITVAVKLPSGRRSALRKRTSPRQQPQPWHESDPHQCPLPSRPVMRGKIRRLIPCPCHTIRQRKKYNPGLYIRDKVLDKSELAPVDVFISKDIHKYRNKMYLKVPPELIDEGNNERLKRDKILKTRKAMVKEPGNIEDQDISELREELENVINEDIQDDYDQLQLDDDLQPQPTDTSFCDAENNVLEPAHPPDQIQNEANLVFEPITPEELELIGDQLYEPCTIHEASLQRAMAHHMLRAQKSISSNEIFQRVNKWKSSITEKLEAEEKRKHFDIHAYGYEIINKFSKIGETLTFEEVAKAFPAKEVSRVFLSCLMLGNSYNVELSNSGGSLSMDDLKLKLLSRVQQHQHMEEYAAPSQQQLSPKRKRTETESILMHHRGTKKKKKVTFDSGMFSATFGGSFSFANI